jgi:hypothetical protein
VPLPRSTTVTLSSRTSPGVGCVLAPEGTGPGEPQAASATASATRAAIGRNGTRDRARFLGLSLGLRLPHDA